MLERLVAEFPALEIWLEEEGLRIENGRVYKGDSAGVVVSHGYGLGWATHGEDPFDVIAVLMHLDAPFGDKHYVAIHNLLNPTKECPLTCGLDQYYVHWVERGTQFRFSEYDGSEDIIFYHGPQWYS
jgi:hypothetical protein